MWAVKVLSLNVYEVSCPSCHAVVNTPFVRVGAAVTCAACGHRYLIGQAHYKRVPATAAGEGSAPIAASPKAPDTPQAGPDDSSAGLHGLTEMMRVEAQRERDSKFDDYDTIKSDVKEHHTPIDIPPPPDVLNPAKETKAQKAGRGGYLLAAAAAVALAVLGGGLWMFNWDLSAGSSASNTPVPEAPPKPVYEGPKFEGLPLVGSFALEQNPWEQPNSPYQSSPQGDPSVFVADADLVPSDSGAIEYVGQVVSEHESGVVLAGELTVSLVNRQGIEKARATAPIAMVGNNQPMRIRLPIPASLDPTPLNPAWSIKVTETWASAVPVEDASMEALSVGAESMAKILLLNDTDDQLDRAELLITAWDAQAKPLRRWRVSWTTTIAPHDDIEFYARTAVTPSWQIDNWTVLAVGEFSPAPPVSDDPDEQAD